MLKRTICSLLGLLALSLSTAAPRAAETAQTPAAPADRMTWFKEAKFGMFIHWGLYAVPAGEWKGATNHAEWIMLTAKIPSAEYEKFAPQFNPVKFDAKAWADLAKEAGMKYMVITAKHHDGFSMYDSKLTDYDIVDATPYKHDPMKDLAEAARADNLTFCFYYSLPDWHYPDFPAKYGQRGGFHGNPNPNADIEKYVEYMKGQLKELLTNYGPIGLIWFDGGGAFKGEGVDMPKLLHGQEIVDEIHRLQPNALINDRLKVGGDYGTPEQKIPDSKQDKYFETCMTLNKHWGYNSHDENWKEAPEVIQKLADVASKGGNFLLNVGPKADGTMPDKAIEILKEVGKWMDKNGESIYGTTASPLAKQPDWGRLTAKGDNKLYAHIFKAPAGGELKLDGAHKSIDKAWLLADKTPLETAEDGETIVITLPKEMPDKADTVVVVTLKD